MESKATDLQAVLKNPNTSVDSKVAHLTAIKSDIKQRNVPADAIAPIFESLRLAIASQHSSLSAAGFSALGHLLKRLYIQEHHHAVALQARNLYPLLLDRLGDHKERVRAQAAQAFTDLWPASSAEVEHIVLETALVGKNPRAKETSMVWLSTMTREHGLLFRNYVPSLVSCLEDADSGVRETAKTTVIELFQNAPSRAKSDLKKQLVLHNVRKSIASVILSSLGLSPAELEMSSSSMSLSQSRSDSRRPGSSLSTHRGHEPPRSASVLSSRSQGNNEDRETSSRSRSGTLKGDTGRTGTQPASESFDSLASTNPDMEEGEQIEPLYVNSNREIDEMVRGMLYHFEGRESEQNWVPREKAVLTLRRLTRGNAPQDYSQHYLAGIKTLLDGILKTVNSLRTTLSTTGCLLLQDIARTCGPAIDPMVEVLMQNLIKLCAGMKKISAQNGNATVDVILANVSYNIRLLQHISYACQDKNVQPRLFATEWLRTIIKKQAHHKGSVEHGGGLDLIEKCIKKGLSDANPGVREGMRSTFWVFYRIWPDRANDIMSTLDNKSRGLLEKDPGNPDSQASSANDISRSRPNLASSVSAAAGRQALKETIAAQKKRLAVNNRLPPRPESAQSSFSEAKTAGPINQRPAPKAASSNPAVRTVPTGTHLSSLSSAPMRPGIKARRPDIMRPATADPYADRRPTSSSSHTKGFSPEGSPAKMRARLAATPGGKSSSPTRPKSRLDAAPVSTAKSKPKRLDIASLKAGETRALPSRMRSDSDDLAKSTPSVEQDMIMARSAPAVIDLEADEPVNDQPNEASITYQDGAFVKVPPEPTKSNIHSTPVRHTRLSSDGSASRLPVSVGRHSRNNSEDSKIVSPSLASPPKERHSRNASEDHSSKLPSPITRRSVHPSEETSGATEGLKVYEDPVSPSNEARSPVASLRSPRIKLSPAKSSVLEELPVNEPTTPSHRDNKQPLSSERSPQPSSILTPSGAENTQRRWGKVEGTERKRSVSPRSKDPVKAREMMDKGIVRIRAKALDAHGYRKLQGLIRYHDSIFVDEAKYDEMLLALLDALEAPSDDKKSTVAVRSLDLKTQMLVTLRLILSYNKTWFSAHHPRVMIALLETRKQYELNNHIVSGLEETAEEIVAVCKPPDVIDAVLQLIETEETTDTGYRAITMGIYVLTGLLKRLNQTRVFLSQKEMERLGKFANWSLSQPQPDVRRAVTEFCVELHEMVHNDEAFWRMINSPTGDHRNLLTYYIAKRTAQSTR